MSENEKAFRGELKELMEKHGVTLSGRDQYAGDEEYCGTVYVFAGAGWSFEVNEIAEQQ